MIDLHTHTFLSDGVLGVSELVYRAKLAGYDAIAITDHADESNIEFVLKALKKAAPNLSKAYGIDVYYGVELTYVPPVMIGKLVKKARANGAQLVVVHGETVAENVPPGTNESAIKAKVDILAHPGNITKELVEYAKKNGVCLEITTRRGHKETNKRVFELAKAVGAKLVMNNDAHGPADILNKDGIKKVLIDTGISIKDYEEMVNNAKEILSNINKRRKR
ncbi:MAG: histidinol phosphate phosphatase domain-containing protein [Elusimicrobiota bacterium]